MATDVLYKAISANPFNEGSAVVLGPQAASVPLSVVRSIKADGWAELVALLSAHGNNPWYYKNYPAVPMSSGDYSVSTSGDAVVTYTADTYKKHVITGVAWSYSAQPANGYLKIEDGANNVVFKETISSAGPGFFDFGPGKEGTKNTALIVTLGFAGSGAGSGVINAIGHRTE